MMKNVWTFTNHIDYYFVTQFIHLLTKKNGIVHGIQLNLRQNILNSRDRLLKLFKIKIFDKVNKIRITLFLITNWLEICLTHYYV